MLIRSSGSGILTQAMDCMARTAELETSADHGGKYFYEDYHGIGNGCKVFWDHQDQDRSAKLRAVVS